MSPTPIADVTRRIKEPVRLLLCVRAGGRCEFDGCNAFLFEHHLTLATGNFAQLAHVVAFSVDGPRGGSPRPADINAIENLMLLCHRCHKLIDDHPQDYAREMLQRHKVDHEERIRHLTDLRPNRRTVVLQLKALVRGKPVDIPFADVARAVAPNYPVDRTGHLIDLNPIQASGPPLYNVAKQIVDRRVGELYQPGAPALEIRHISLFALAPIPVLVYLGSRLSSKIPLEVFQRHRDTQDWVWKEGGEPVDYQYIRLRIGEDPRKVALVMSLSGRVDHTRLPTEIDSSFSLYELQIIGRDPSLDFLRRREDLTRFAFVYREFLAMLGREHPQAPELHLFPAVPAPVAVLCGFERLPKVQPHLIVYNNDGGENGFVRAIEVDDRGLD
jgi:hypothetical protein